MDYKACWDYQENLFNETIAQKISNRSLEPGQQIITKNHLLFVEHPHVYTLGKSGDASHLLINDNQLEEKQATYYKINRGGDITYHGPGQLVGYPILDLERLKPDIVLYMRNLEEIIIRTLAEYGIQSERSSGETGVWIDTAFPHKARKICAIGIRCSRWITMHGLALNVNTDLQYFDYIIPCGIANKQVTSLQKELGKNIAMQEVVSIMKEKFEEIFELELG